MNTPPPPGPTYFLTEFQSKDPTAPPANPSLQKKVGFIDAPNLDWPMQERMAAAFVTAPGGTLLLSELYDAVKQFHMEYYTVNGNKWIKAKHTIRHHLSHYRTRFTKCGKPMWTTGKGEFWKLNPSYVPKKGHRAHKGLAAVQVGKEMIDPTSEPPPAAPSAPNMLSLEDILAPLCDNSTLWGETPSRGGGDILSQWFSTPNIGYDGLASPSTLDYSSVHTTSPLSSPFEISASPSMNMCTAIDPALLEFLATKQIDDEPPLFV